MGILNLFGRAKTPSPTMPPAECAHGTLVPRWDYAADIGDMERVSGYRCESCQRDFTPEDAAEVRAMVGL